MALFCSFSLQKINHQNYKTLSNKRPPTENSIRRPSKMSSRKIVDRSTIGVYTVLDYNSQNLNKMAAKDLFDLLEWCCRICIGTEFLIYLSTMYTMYL